MEMDKKKPMAGGDTPSPLAHSLPRSLPLSLLPLPLRELRFAREKVPAIYGNSNVLT